MFKVSKDAYWTDAYFPISYVTRRFPSEDPVGVQAQKKRCRNWSFLFTVLARFLCGRSLKMRIFKDASFSSIYMSRVALPQKNFHASISALRRQNLLAWENEGLVLAQIFTVSISGPAIHSSHKISKNNLVLFGGRSRAMGKFWHCGKKVLLLY